VSDADTQQQQQPPSIEELEARNAELEDRHLRARADLDNYRKRSAAEIDRRVGEARDRLLLDWLEALDSVERALRMDPDADGLRAVLEQMDAILARNGVARIGRPGERFDPERHDAVAVHDGEGEENVIGDVARSGYMLADRVLRPAQVIVTRG
jgi:molecular chaperone GrpE